VPALVKYEPPRNSVYLLGAGFSRAAIPSMPLTKDIGQAITSRLASTEPNLQLPNLEKVGFETWMSWLAVRQPFQSESDFFESQRIFSIVQEEVSSAVQEAELAQIDAAKPQWLYEITELWHARRATVMTLNYDTVVEEALSRIVVTDEGGDVVFPRDTTQYFPDGLTGFGGGPAAAHGTFKLFKMHGSIDWYWVPGDISGASMLKEGFRPLDSAAEQYSRRARIGGRDIFIVPPVQSKSAYLVNPVSRFVWRSGIKALNEADEVALIGYSLPLEDSGIASMLQQSLTSNRAARVTVVDRQAKQVGQRLLQLGLRPDQIDVIAGDRAVSNFVRDEATKASRWLASEVAMLGKKSPSAPVGISWIFGWAHPTSVRRSSSRSDRVVLTCTRVSHPGQMVRPGAVDENGPILPQSLTLQEIASVIKPNDYLVADIDGSRYTLAGLVANDDVGLLGSDEWVLLHPIGVNR
jgi:hypothetical protein